MVDQLRVPRVNAAGVKVARSNFGARCSPLSVTARRARSKESRDASEFLTRSPAPSRLSFIPTTHRPGSRLEQQSKWRGRHVPRTRTTKSQRRTRQNHQRRSQRLEARSASASLARMRNPWRSSSGLRARTRMRRRPPRLLRSRMQATRIGRRRMRRRCWTF